MTTRYWLPVKLPGTVSTPLVPAEISIAELALPEAEHDDNRNAVALKSAELIVIFPSTMADGSMRYARSFCALAIAPPSMVFSVLVAVHVLPCT